MNDEAQPLSALEQILAALKTPVSANEEALKPENLRYVLYARKSTHGDERQEKSIPDQIADCLERVVEPNGINLSKRDIVEEKGSAKEPDIRPQFRQVLDDLKDNKYDGLIAWHPDRLARNMKEAGEIIDLLDKGFIKDLRFATSTFENNPTGKMLLGISFVLSKQYSEHLSESVTRGNRHKILSGNFIGKFKHGYYKTEDGRLYPDGENFVIIQRALEMRLEGSPQAEIMRYLNSHRDYTVFRLNKDKKTYARKSYKWDKDSVSELLKDTTNAGILLYGLTAVNLIDLYDFTPLIDAEDFLKINEAGSFLSAKFKSKYIAPTEGAKADLLRGVIICKSCSKPLSSGLTTKQNGIELRYRYRCDTETCPMLNKGPRAKVVIDYAIDFLDKHRFTTKSNYEQYAHEVAENKVARNKELTGLIASLNNYVEEKRREYDNAKRIAADQDNALQHHYAGGLDDLEADLKKLRKELANAKRDKEQLMSAIPTYEKYLELFGNVANLLRQTKNPEKLNKILLKFFSKLIVEGQLLPPKNRITRWQVTSCKLKEPYAGFLQSNNFDSGGESQTVLELFYAIVRDTDKYKAACNQLQELQDYKPKRSVLVVL